MGSITRSQSSRSRVELRSDGTRHGTHVWLVIEDEEGHVMRYKIPHVMLVRYEMTSKGSRDGSLTIELENVDVETQVKVGGDSNTSIQDLLAEIAAARLRSSDK